MAKAYALCPVCGTRLTVEDTDDATICTVCGKPFITAKGIEAAYSPSDQFTDSENDPDMFPFFYNITIEREKKIVGALISYVFAIDDQPAVLGNGQGITITTNRKRIYLPVLKTNNSDLFVEGFLVGSADGRDINIKFAACLGKSKVANLKASTNPTISFVTTGEL